MSKIVFFYEKPNKNIVLINAKKVDDYYLGDL